MGRGSPGLSLQVPQRPRKGHIHLLVWVLVWFGFPPLLLAGKGMHFTELEHQCLPWEGAEEGREGNSGHHCSAQHIKEIRMSSDANTAHRALPWLNEVGVFVCDIFPGDQISFSVAIELHINRALVMAKTWRKFVLFLHKFMLQLPDLIRLIISSLYMLSN